MALNLFLEDDMHQSGSFGVQILKVVAQYMLKVVVAHASCVPLEKCLVHLGGHIGGEQVDCFGETLMDEIKGPVSLLLVGVLSYT
jgi:hypothetical protein